MKKSLVIAIVLFIVSVSIVWPEHNTNAKQKIVGNSSIIAILEYEKIKTVVLDYEFKEKTDSLRKIIVNNIKNR